MNGELKLYYSQHLKTKETRDRRCKTLVLKADKFYIYIDTVGVFVVNSLIHAIKIGCEC